MVQARSPEEPDRRVSPKNGNSPGASVAAASLRCARRRLQIRGAAGKPAAVVEKIIANAHPLIGKLAAKRLFRHIFGAVSELSNLVGLDLDEAGAGSGFHASSELNELGHQQSAAVFIERLFVEHEPIDVGDFLTIFV